MDESGKNIKYLFEPRGIAVIGASDNKNKISYKVVENIKLSGYKGDVYPINPKGGEILEYEVYKNITEVKGEIDVAMIVIPAKFVFDAVKLCAKKKVKYLCILASGFSEIGNVALEQAIVKFARGNGMRILGPNVFGFYSAYAPINASFAPRDINPGSVAMISQSGALGTAMIGKTKIDNIGLSAIISMGNKSDLDESDVIEYLIDHNETKVIFMYMEGIKNGPRLIEVLKKATPIKPVVVIKSGRSKKGAMAAASHTGSLTTTDELFNDIMNQCGVHRAETIQEALNWCNFLSKAPKPTGPNTVIITNGGGVGVLAADACEKYKVHLYDDFQALKNIFGEIVPEFGSVKNPIDITGQGGMKSYEDSIEAAMKHPDIHSIICLGCEHALFTESDLKDTVEKLHNKYGQTKPIVYSFFGGEGIRNGVNYLRAKGVQAFTDVYDAISCLGEMYRDYRKDKTEISKDITTAHDIDFKKINKIIEHVKSDDRSFLLADESHALMQAAGILMPKSKIATNIKEAITYAKEIGFPVVMKIVSKDIIHKSDAGGIALNLLSEEEIIDAWEAITHNCKRYNSNAKIKGIEITEMVKQGTETIIGARRDAVFGPTIMFGLGGIYVEVMKDVSFRSLPLSHNEIQAMLKNIRSYPLLLGVRGEAKKDINSIIDVIMRVGLVLLNVDCISDIEVNPLIAYKQGHGVMAVDARILIK